MNRFEVKITNGKYSAPSIYIDAVRDTDAEKQAKTLSRLSSFDEWQFIATKINYKL